MDLRAPLHDANNHVGDGNSDSQISHDNGTAPWVPTSSITPTKNSNDDHGWYETIIYHHLCRMYVASQAMELGSESRFTGLILFHRYVRHFFCLVQQKRQQQQEIQSTQEGKQIKSHLGTVAAACLFLGCKMEEEPRRIRDVINLKHLLNFSEEDNDGNVSITPVKNPKGEGQHRSQHKSQLLENEGIITFLESQHPPPLDEKYWTAKEEMISAEQHVLRMVKFDTTVCHPHRCVLIIMQTLGFGIGRKASNNGRQDDEQDDSSKNWLLTCEQSENVIVGAWKILNDVPLDARGIALQYPVIALSCAAISLAAAGDQGVSSAVGNDGNDGKIVSVSKLPEFWWRALDIPTEDVFLARNALQKGLAQ